MTIQKIIADRETIQIQGVGALGALAAYEYQPLEAITAGSEPAGTTTSDGINFSITMPRFYNGRDRLYSRFKVKLGEVVLPGISYVTDMVGIAAYDYPFPQAHTIKGLQVHDVQDAIQLGVAHAALNLNQPTVMLPQPSETTITYEMDGQEFYFDGTFFEDFDERVTELSSHGVTIYLILLNSAGWGGLKLQSEMAKILIHPNYDPEGFISAFNVVTAEGLAHYKAFVEFVAERYSRDDQKYGRVSGYIIGNEVDAAWIWSNAGEKTVASFMEEYTVAVRTAFYAARKMYSEARVYITLTHHWTLPHTENQLRTYAGRDIIEIMNRLSIENGNFDWSVAYHPYPQDLRIPSFWNDDKAFDTLDTPLITFKNIEVLTRYMRQPHLLFDGRIRHIILSEQGLNSEETDESERIQAAAYALAYWKIARTNGIEAFIYHAHVDHRDEFGLNLGIRRRDKSSDSPNAPGVPKLVHVVFKGIDGEQADALFEDAKGVIGEGHWG